MPFKHIPEAMISVAATNSKQASPPTESFGKGGSKDLPSSETGTPSSSSTEENVAGAVSAEDSPKLKPDQAMDDPDKCSTEQAAIASIILQLSQQPAKKRRTRSAGDSDMPKLATLSPPAATSPAPVKNEIEERDRAAQVPKAKPTIVPQPTVQQEGRTDPVLKHHPSPPMQPQVAKQGNPADAALSCSVMQALKQGSLSKAAETRKPYRCSKCGAEKKGHQCSAKSAAEMHTPSSQVVEVKRGDLAARLAARLQGKHEGGDAGEDKTSPSQASEARDEKAATTTPPTPQQHQQLGILLATTKQDLERIPFVASYSAVEVFDQGVINHPALASGLPVLLKCPPEGWSAVVQLPSVVPGP